MPREPPARGQAEKALTELFREHADFVWRLLRRFGLSTSEAEDAVQEVFLVVHRRLDSFLDGSMRAWLCAICRRVASGYRRTEVRAANRALRVVDTTPMPDPEELAASREALALVSEVIDRLDEPRRTIFYLAQIEGMSAPEIAAALDMNLNTVYTRLRAGRRDVERWLAERASEARR